jgi:hypothetical protein
MGEQASALEHVGQRLTNGGVFNVRRKEKEIVIVSEDGPSCTHSRQPMHLQDDDRDQPKQTTHCPICHPIWDRGREWFKKYGLR